jgi:hypothetical protein
LNCNGENQVLIKFQQNSSEQDAIHYVLRSRNLLILFGIRKNCHCGSNPSLYLFLNCVIKLTVVIIEGYHYFQRRGPFDKVVNWRHCASVMQRKAVTVIPSCILVSRVTPHAEDIIGYHRCIF